MNTENKPSAAAMRAAEKHYLGDVKSRNLREQCDESINRLATIIDAELASESLEQRATAAAEEIEGNMIPIRSGQSNVIRAQKIILHHFSGLGGGNEKLREALTNCLKARELTGAAHASMMDRLFGPNGEVRAALAQSPADNSRKENV